MSHKCQSNFSNSPVKKLPESPMTSSYDETDEANFYNDIYKDTHLFLVHINPRPSPLSPESPIQNYSGLFNLALLMLVISTAISAFDNFRTYGLLFITLPGHSIPYQDFLYCFFIIFILSPCFLLSSYLLELISKSDYLMVAKFVNISSLLITTFYLTWNKISHFIPGLFALCSSITLSMKLISFHLVLRDLKSLNSKTRALYLLEAFGEESTTREYPWTTLRYMFYYWATPTLCFQFRYPKSPSFRWKFFFCRLFELFSCIAMIYILIQQYAVPTVVNSFEYLVQLDLILILERLLLLSLSNVYIWLLFFYAFFHSFLNCVAEVINFGDRSFYLPWWNSTSIEEYWRLWNQPVHIWMKRHVYLPLRRRGFSSFFAIVAIFGLSGIIHEIAIGFPTKVVQLWAFLGFMLQVPLIFITKYAFINFPAWKPFGNYFFWISFCIVGQPMCVLLYYRAWALSQTLEI